MNRLLILASLLGLAAADATSAAEIYRFQHENVFGTSCELILAIDVGSPPAESAAESPAVGWQSPVAVAELAWLEACQAEQTALAEINRLDAIFSRYRGDSELAGFRGDRPVELSSDLAAVLLAAERYRQSTGGAFDPRAGAWQGGPIDSVERRRLTERLAREPYQIDPRTGRSVSHHPSVSVFAPSAMQADAMATAISVLPTEQALRWMQSQVGTGCLIVASSGQPIVAGDWPSGRPAATAAAADGLPESVVFHRTVTTAAEVPAGLHVQFTLHRPEKQRYRRPYVAVWLEDEDGFPVKTGLLWLQKESPGPQWHRDLTRWYRNDRLRKIHEKVDLIETVGGATRGPGQYQVHFDGTDNLGQPLADGRYTLYLEVTREHGTYQLIRQPIDWGDEVIERTALKPNEEISSADFHFQPAVAAEVQ